LCDKKILSFADSHRADCRFHFFREQEQILQRLYCLSCGPGSHEELSHLESTLAGLSTPALVTGLFHAPSHLESIAS
jgi:hypothetical protein